MLCTALILISVSLVTSAQDVFFFWLAMEFVSLVFVGLLVSTNSASSLGQYFTANATATVFFLVGAITGNPITMSGAFIIKLGAAPAHAWVKRSMKGADWFCLWVFLGPMKLIPIVGLTTIHVEWQVIWILMGGAMFASVVGVCQKSSQSLLVYLSIVSSGWIGMVAVLPDTPVKHYWMLFSAAMFVFLATIGSKASFVGILAGLGLVGLPPGPMFVGKWAVYQFVASWLGVPLTAFLAATAIYMFVMMLTLLALGELTSPLKLEPSDVVIILVAWSLFCFIMWW